MIWSNKCLLPAIVVVGLLAGCASAPTPLRELVSTGNPNASRISITSINEANIFDRNSVLPGKIYIDSIFYGEFSKNQREFAAEVLPGTRVVVVCPENDNKCINMQINVVPNKNYRYKYTLSSDYMVVMARLTWKLIPLGVEDYRPLGSNSIPVPIQNRLIPADTKAGGQDDLKNLQAKPNHQIDTGAEVKMEAASTRCSALGFQSGTQSFGECVLRLSK
jgi:hypothetical protein